MGLSGKWKAQQSQPYANILTRGSGWNAVHASRNAGSGRGIATHEVVRTAEDQTGEFAPDAMGYCDEDTASSLWGANPGTGISTRSLGADSSGRGSVGSFPSFGGRTSGVPGGGPIRSVNHGADITVTAKEQQPPALESPYKTHGDVIDAEVSDDAQYVMQTSMRQRDTSRTGSQTSGRANAPRSSISSRIPGHRLKTYQGGYRHAEMQPKRQDIIFRGFWTRTAATGDPALMHPNAMYQADPRQREPVSEPYIGTPVQPDANFVGDPYGYTSEDTLPYV